MSLFVGRGVPLSEVSGAFLEFFWRVVSGPLLQFFLSVLPRKGCNSMERAVIGDKIQFSYHMSFLHARRPRALRPPPSK